jgi:hypothetical protein
MPIRFLDNLNLEENQLLNTSLQQVASDPTGFAGQIIFNTTSRTFKYYNGSVWIELDGRGDISGVTAGTGLSGGGTSGTVTVSVDYLGSDNIILSAPAAPAVVDTDLIIISDETDSNVKKTAISTLPFTNNDGTVTSVGTSSGTFVSVTGGTITSTGTISADLSATGTASNKTFLRGDNVWASIPAGYQSWSLGADSPSTLSKIGDLDIVNIKGGVGLSSSLSSAGGVNDLVIDLDNTAVTAGSYTLASITVDAQGRITAASSGSAGAMNSFNIAGDNAGSQSIIDGDTIKFAGKEGIVTNGTAVNDEIGITLDLTELPVKATYDAKTDQLVGIFDKAADQGKIVINTITLDSWGAAKGDVNLGTNKLIAVSDPTAAQDAATKNYVDTTFAGSGALIYQGGYDASAAAPNANALKGWTYAVTKAGDGNGYFSTPLEVGDLIIANIDSPKSEADWTEVNKNIDVATATVQGIANFPTAGGLSVSNGAVSLPNVVTAGSFGSATQTPSVTVDAKGRVTSISNTSIQITSSQVTNFCNDVEDCIKTRTEFAGTIGDGVTLPWRVNHKLGSQDVMVQVYDTKTFETLMVSVVRVDLNNVEIVTTKPIAPNGARVLIKQIG